MRVGAGMAAAATVLLLLTVSGCGEDKEGDRLADGKDVYVRECARCHMADGSGVAGVYPNLAGNPIVTLESPEPMIDIVLSGTEAMPAFEGSLPAHQIADVISYVRHAWGNGASPVTPAQAK